jgi:hypothetical protein
MKTESKPENSQFRGYENSASDEKSRIYGVSNVGKTVLVVSNNKIPQKTS